MKNQPVVTHHRLQSIGDLLVAMQCHPLDMMRLVIYESHMEEYEDSVTEVLFVPLGHQRYVRLFRDINDINCHPTLGTKRYIGVSKMDFGASITSRTTPKKITSMIDSISLPKL